MNVNLTAAVLILLALSMMCLTVAAKIYRAERRIGFKILLLIFTVIFYPLSGVAHIVSTENLYRGFFELAKLPEKTGIGILVEATTVTAIALISLILGINPLRKDLKVGRSSTYDAFAGKQSRLASVFGLLLIAGGGFATWIISQVIEFSAISRGRTLEAGFARYAFISTWIGWGLSFLFLHLAFGRENRQTLFRFLGLIGCLLCIGANVYWTGGRSVALLLAMPVLITTLAKTPSSRFGIAVAIVYGLALGVYAIYLSLVRTENFYAYNISVLGFMDWEFGRFSMVGYALDYVDRRSYLFGMTFIAALLHVLTAPLYLLGIDIRSIPYAGEHVTNIIGRDMFGSADMNYVVPGLVPELYMNGSYIAVIVGMFIVGRAARWVDRKFFESVSIGPFSSLLYAFFGSLLCLNLMNTTAFGFVNYLFFNGFPLILGAALFERSRRRAIIHLGIPIVSTRHQLSNV